MAENSPQASTANKKKTLMIVGAVVVLLLAGLGAYLWEQYRSSPTKDGEASTETAQTAEDIPESTVDYYAFKPPFVVNFFIAGKQRYLQVSLTAMFSDASVKDALLTHDPLIRNKLVMLLSGESLEELQTIEGKMQLQAKMLAAIQEILQQEIQKPGVEQVLFDSFVIQ